MQLGIFPGNGRAGLDLGPADLGVPAFAQAALGHEIINPAPALLVARIPVLHGRVLDLRIIQRHQFHHRGVQLVLIAHRRRAALQVAHRSAFFGHDQRALELPGVGRVDPEIGGQLHRAPHPRRNETKRAVAEHRRIEGGEKVIRVGHDHPQIFLHQVGMIVDRLAKRAENDALLGQLFLERGAHRHAVKHRIHRHAGQPLAFLQRDA